jgi:ATP-dependent DNA helicase RecG
VRDDTGRPGVVFFNQPWRAKQLTEGTEAIFWGKVGDYRGTRQMVNPVVDVVAGVDEPVVGRQRRTLRILPVYPASAKAG